MSQEQIYAPSHSATLDAPPEPRANFYLVGLGAVLTFGSLLIPFTMPLAGGSAYLVGSTLAECLMAWLIVMGIAAVVMRGRSPNTRAIARIVLGAVLSIGVTVKVVVAVKQERESRAAQHDLYSHMHDSIQHPGKAYVPADIGHSSNRDVEFMHGLQQLLVENSTRQQAILARQAALPLKELIAAKTLASLPAIASSREALASLRQINADRKATVEQFINEMTHYLKVVDVDETTRAGTLKGFHTAMDMQKPRLDAFIDVENDLADQLSEMLDFAEAQHAHIKLVNNQLMFMNPALLAQYRAKIEHLRELAAREKQTMADLQAGQKVIDDRLVNDMKQTAPQ
ncbi:MAG: hypothetical protein JO142_10235 [Burkholderiales bacterium]|nr:hypothetical protein [Burkholderiales bacterium]